MGKGNKGGDRAAEEPPRRVLPVTLLSGFLGAGKTTLLKSILRNKQGMKIAVIVNDMGAVNIDAEEIKGAKLVQEKVEMVEMQNGCICCTLRGDLLKSVKELSESDANFDYLVIESTGIAEPLPVAQTFVMDVNGGGHKHEHEQQQAQKPGELKPADFEPLNKYSRMDTLVTVLDSYNFRDILGKVESEMDRRQFIGENEEQEDGNAPLANLLIDQIEFANVILLNKTDLLPKGELEDVVTQLGALLRKLNPDAQVVIPEKPFFEDFDVKQVVNTKTFDMDAAQRSAGWAKELFKPAHTPETEEYGISSVVFKRNGRPLHPQRFSRLLNGWGELLAAADAADVKAKGPFTGVVRAKGQLWLANHDGCGVNMHTAGRQLEFHLNSSQPWIAKIPEDLWYPEHKETAAAMRAAGKWDAMYGDRRSQLVCIGVDMDKAAIIAALEDALMTEEEMKGGWPEWRKLDDPFFHTGYLEFVNRERPFHPTRLCGFLKTFGTREHDVPEEEKGIAAGVMSAKGEVWLACSDAGPFRVQTRGNELAAAPRQEPFLVKIHEKFWGAEQKAQHAALVKDGQWSAAHGDRHSALHCVGLHFDRAAVEAQLRECLLTDEEMKGGPEAWKKLDNPFVPKGGKAEKRPPPPTVHQDAVMGEPVVAA